MKKLTIVIAAIILALLPSACRKEKLLEDRQFSFTATTEKPQDADSKVYLYDEHIIVWEYDDEISIGSNMTTGGNEDRRGWLYSATSNPEDWSDYNGVFLTSLPDGSQYFLGLYPASSNNFIKAHANDSYDFDQIKIELPATQSYRNDNTFDKSVFPMVAWYGGNWGGDPYTPFNLDFHSLGAIVRLQFVNKTEADANLSSIVITSSDKQLCGMFTVNNYKTNNPYLTATDNSSNRTVTLDCEEISFPRNELLTYYLVLPAIAGRETTTEYTLTATVNTTNSQSCSRSFQVKTRRNGVSYMQALEISDWSSTPAASISGNGTEARPFKVYKIEDLQYLRDCYNSVGRLINGQPITEDTYIKLMRSDIVLTSSNWTAGIRSFVGHFEYAGSNQSHPGITNTNPNVPLFESIDADGEVVGLTVKSSGSNNLTAITGISPFCTENNGRIIDCVLTSNPSTSDFTISIFSPFAGICVTNNGTIQGCGCTAKVEVQDNKDFAGICMHNSGTIKGCYISDVSLRLQAKAAGICYENTTTGTVEDCYYSAQINGSTADWGGIVYENSGTVKHCYINNKLYTSKHLGGIVRTNLAGEVNYCYVEGQLKGQSVGGVVDSLVGGKMINCFTQNTAMLTVSAATSMCGGLAAYMKGGSIENSYALDVYIERENVAATVGGIVGKATGGSVDNCYSLEDFHLFYGSSSGTTYSNCHLVNGAQSMSGISLVSSSTANAFVTMQSALNSNKPSGGKAWTGAVTNTTPPVLEGYSISSKRRN